MCNNSAQSERREFHQTQKHKQIYPYNSIKLGARPVCRDTKRTQKGHRRDRREEGIRNYKSYESAIHSDEFLLDMDSKNYGQK